MKKIIKNHPQEAGLSFVELLATVAIIGIIASVSLALISGSSDSLTETKLESDVSNLNNTIKVYLANGGSLEGIDDAQDVVTELKKGTANEKTVVGLRGSSVDVRLEAVKEIDGEQIERAVWKSEQNRFVIEMASEGVREFRLNEELAGVNYDDVERHTRLLYNAADGWVWESQDHHFALSTGPTALPEADAPTLGASGGSGASNQFALGAPTISPGSGYQALVSFPLNVSITKRESDPYSTVIYYSTVPNTWNVYSEPFPVAPGTEVKCYASSSDPAWADSDHVSSTFSTNPEALEIDIYTPKNPITYAEAGGELEPGDYVPEEPLAPIEVTLPSGWTIPDVYQNSDKFQFHWTVDGSDPRTSTTSTTGITFTDGYKNNNGYGNNYSEIDISNQNWESKALQEGWTQAQIDAFKVDDENKPHDKITYTIDQWDDNMLMPIRVVALSKNSSFVTNSIVLDSNIAIERTHLRTPKIVTTSEPVRGDTVELSLEVDFGDMPTGSRIYYTTDGTDPGHDGEGNPLSGTLYTGPFDPLLDAGEYEGEVMIIARVYPPENFSHWFEVSSPSNSFYLVPTWEVSGLATGWFTENGEQSSIRNDSDSGSYFEWSDLDGETATSIENVSNRERFQIGQLGYYNGSGYSVGDLESFDFSIELDLMSTKTQFDYSFNQYVTYNTGSVWDNADMITLQQSDPSQRINLFGEDYILNLQFGESTANSSTTLNEFQVQEGELGVTSLYAQLISLGSWWYGGE